MLVRADSWRVIAYASRNLTDVERRYSQTGKEALALVWECERFNLYVFGHEFELETYHKPLECIYRKTSKPSARIERWVLCLQGYDYNVVYFTPVSFLLYLQHCITLLEFELIFH